MENMTHTNVISELKVVTSNIIDLNRLYVIEEELKALKNEKKSTLGHIFSTLSDIDLDIIGLENLTNNQKRLLVLNEIEINLETEYSVKILSYIKWYYSSKLSLKKEYVTLANLKQLKKLRKCYLKADINRIFKDTTIVTSKAYNEAINKVLDNAIILDTALSNDKSKEVKALSDYMKNNNIEEIKGLIWENGSFSYDIKEVDYKALRGYNHSCYIETLENEIKEA